MPVEQVADIQVHQGPDMIKSEGSRRAAWVFVDIHDIDVGTYISQGQGSHRGPLEDSRRLQPHLERAV